MKMQSDNQVDEKKIYPSIDKPWLKYYTDEQINAELPQYKAFDYIYEKNKEYKNSVAFNYYGRKITYGQFFDQTESAGKAFLEAGVKKASCKI